MKKSLFEIFSLVYNNYQHRFVGNGTSGRHFKKEIYEEYMLYFIRFKKTKQ